LDAAPGTSEVCRGEVDPVAGVLGKLMRFKSWFQLGQPHGIIPHIGLWSVALST
jgi:hypothetical protein